MGGTYRYLKDLGDKQGGGTGCFGTNTFQRGYLRNLGAHCLNNTPAPSHGSDTDGGETG